MQSENWGQRTERSLRNATYAVINSPQPASLVGLEPCFPGLVRRKGIVGKATAPSVTRFRKGYEHDRNDRFPAETSAALINNVGNFVGKRPLRDVVRPVKSTFEAGRMMESVRSLLCDPSKGVLGGDVSSLSGSLIVTRVALAQLLRQDMSEAGR